MLLPPITPQAIAAAGKLAINPAALITIVKQGPKIWGAVSEKYGSKVKRGAFQDCQVEMFGDKACIVVNKDSGEAVMLTSDTIQSCRYVKEKKKLGSAGYHTYFYYDITFKDGSESYVRMRRKYRDAMEQYT